MNKSSKALLAIVAMAIAATSFFLTQKSASPYPADAVSTTKDKDEPQRLMAPANPVEQPLGHEVSQQALGGGSPQLSVPVGVRPQLPSERLLLGTDGINADALNLALEKPRFESLMSGFERDAATDSLASQLTSAARAQIDGQFQGAGLRLDRFACGLTLCAGLVQSAGRTDTALNWWQKLGDGDDVRVYVFYDTKQSLSDGRTEQRFVFSIDPKVTRIYGKAGPGS